MDLLERARKYEKEKEVEITKEERPVFHLSPRVGWLNDPNGFSYFAGEFHLYYQYYPYDVHWNSMHWGHWSSQDLVHWEFQKAAMAPEEAYESGCFSGTCLTGEGKEPLFFYTAHKEEKDETMQSRIVETQCIASYRDGELVKFRGNPVLSEKDLPEGFLPADFRDPKVWKEGEAYHVLTVGRGEDGLGAVLHFQGKSPEALHFRDFFLKNEGSLGNMWECPDYFLLDGKRVLLLSLMGVKDLSPEFRNGYCGMAFLTEEGEAFSTEKKQPLDLGFDFYAPQTMEYQGRRILIGWMQAPETGNTAPFRSKWFGQMSFPRELRIVEGKLRQNPIPEIRRLYGKGKKESYYVKGGDSSYRDLGEFAFSTMDICFRIRKEEKPYRGFTLLFAVAGERYIRVSYDKDSGVFVVDRSHSPRSFSIPDRREVQIGKGRDATELRLLLDRFSFELFLDSGEKVFSGTMYEHPREAKGMLLRAEGAQVDVESWEMKESME